jgi:predicted acylesterase/phospholipase RssA
VIAGADDWLREELVKLAGPQLILIEGDQPYADILAPMMHTLATAVARDRPNTAVVEYGKRTMVSKWSTAAAAFPVPTLNGQMNKDELRGLFDPDKPGCVFVVRSSAPENSAPIEQIEFDQLVYLTDRIPRSVPAPLRRCLRSEVFDPESDDSRQEPYLVAFVPTVPVPFHNPPPGATTRHFEELPIAHSLIDDDKVRTPRGLRPYRDACVLPIRRGALRRAWDAWLPAWQSGKQTQFLDSAVKAGALRRDSAERWARAVVKRRVGVACSGGGASAYRFIPILERLHALDVPIDVFAGLSGGALLGAFYCLRGCSGLGEYVALGTLIQLTMPLSYWHTTPFERITDKILGGARIENLEVRLGAVTVALADDKCPYGAVVVNGTLGEAARVSGTLPPAFGPTEKNSIRYTDGGACTAVPARVARDYGADVILSCNAIPGPDKCNPYLDFFGKTIGGLLRRLPPWDRFLDLHSWLSFQSQQTSRIFGEEADAFIEFPSSKISVFEPVMFIRAREIIHDALEDEQARKRIDEQTNALRKAWQDLLR